jgi:hypothetical protein
MDEENILGMDIRNWMVVVREVENKFEDEMISWLGLDRSGRNS